MSSFFDTSILLYALARDDPRQGVALRLLAEDGTINVQVLNEFASVVHRKLKLSWPDVDAALSALRKMVAPPLPVTSLTHEAALALAGRYALAFYDALIVAAAIEAKCDTLFSEDMQSGMSVDSRLIIINPFLPN